MDKPIIAITMGDADGIGPEIIVKVLSQAATYERCRPFVVGDPRVMEAISKVVGANLSFKTIERLSEASFSPAVVEVMCPKGAHIDRVEWGRLDPAMGKAAALCLEEAFDLAESGQIQGLVSAPLNKQAFRMAGYDYLDELAYMAERTGSPEPYIVGRTDEVWTIAVMGHVPFRDIVDLIKRERVLRYIESLNGMLKRVGVGKPKIAVAALNVHGGEGGLLGPEESEEIGPAIADARAESIDAQGPFPADTIFLTAIEQGFDAVVSMYHDQANIARKLLARRKGATLYMGLPVVWGTTAHGTAFDKAGQGVSDPASLQTALAYTSMLAAGRGGVLP